MVMILEFSICDVKIKVQYGFVVIISLALIANNMSILYVLLFSVLHELGHIISLYIVGGKPSELVFSYYGIGLKHNSNLTYPREFVFLLSGILVNGVFTLLNIHRDINLALLILNSLPIYPLDMGRCIKMLLDRCFDANKSYKVFSAISFVFVICFGVYSFYTRNISLIMVFIYLFANFMNRGSLC